MDVQETEEPSKDEPPEKNPRADRVRFHDDADIEAGRGGPAITVRPSLHRSISRGSLSIHSVNSNTGAIDPSAALPIQYRTL